MTSQGRATNGKRRAKTAAQYSGETRQDGPFPSRSLCGWHGDHLQIPEGRLELRTVSFRLNRIEIRKCSKSHLSQNILDPRLYTGHCMFIHIYIYMYYVYIYR